MCSGAATDLRRCYVDLLIWAGVAAGGLYVVECAVWPYKRCAWCKGTGVLRSPVTRAWRDCRCGGDGRAVRLGRRAFEVVRGGFS